MCRYALLALRQSDSLGVGSQLEIVEPVRLADLTTRRVHSIIKQAEDCQLRLDGSLAAASCAQQENLNADGFGLGA
jgi:hypothetical protein